MSHAAPKILEHKNIDFLGGGRVPLLVYRLGDVFDLWYLVQYNITFDQLVKECQRLFPGTLALQYLLKVGSKEYAHRNLTALRQVVLEYEKKEEEEESLFTNDESSRHPDPNDLVVHLRLGDVLTSDCCTDLSRSISEQWYTKEGFVNRDCNIKHNYNLIEYQELVSRMPSHVRQEIQRCVIIGAAFITDQDNSVRNQEYKDFGVAFFRQRLDCEIAYDDNPNPDETLLYMAHAHWIMVAMSGYSQIAAALVRVRRGRNHVWHDKFKGHIAGCLAEGRFTRRATIIRRSSWLIHSTRFNWLIGVLINKSVEKIMPKLHWDSGWFDAYRKQVYAADYIDWKPAGLTCRALIGFYLYSTY